jgi:glycosyltransferase involved in cell wall biosynthesis
MIERELREYALADHIVVLSTFAKRSFLDHGVPWDHLSVLTLGADVRAFRPSPAVVDERRRRLTGGAPIRVVYVGALSMQKGLEDLIRIARTLRGEAFEFRLVGVQTDEVRPLLAQAGTNVTWLPSRPQAELPPVYWDSDLFLFPTIHDGFGMVLSQALAAGLPVLTTTNCGGADLLHEGLTGWVLPIRQPEAFVQRLRWCDAHRADLCGMAGRIAVEYRSRDWSDVAADFEGICRRHVGRALLAPANAHDAR